LEAGGFFAPADFYFGDVFFSNRSVCNNPRGEESEFFTDGSGGDQEKLVFNAAVGRFGGGIK
jgi:hypothetical protein